MQVRFAGGKLNGEAAAWYPPHKTAAYPSLIATEDGEHYRLGVRPHDDVATYHHESFDPSRAPYAINDVVSQLRGKIPDELLPVLLSALQPVQKFIDDASSDLGRLHTRNADLEAKLHAMKRED